MKIIRKLVTGLMILLVVLGSTPLEVLAYVPNLDWTEWPSENSNNGTAFTLPQPPAVENIVDLSRMFNYPTLDYSRIPLDPANGQILDFSRNKSYVTKDDSSVAVLTRDSTWQSGVMWSRDDYKVQLDEPFRMVSYVYLGNKGQQNRGADGITFTMHNDKKNATERESGSTFNTGADAYGALGNGLGVYGNHFSGADNSNVYVQMKKGVTNGIALEFDTFYNDEKELGGKQFTDTDLWQYIESGIPNVNDKSVRQGTPNTEYGHIAINYLNDMQDNIANDTGKTFDIVPKHEEMLSVGWDGVISDLDFREGWKVSKEPTEKLADDKWHRLEVKWIPTSSTTGDLTYLIYRDGHIDERNVYSIDDTSNDGSNVLTYTIKDLDVQSVFDVSSTAESVYWGFSGSTGGFQNNQAVQMLQLPVNYYTAELEKFDQDGNPVSGAQFQIEKKDENGNWIEQQFCNPEVDTLETGSQAQDEEICNGVFQTLGKIKLTQLTKGTYRWKEVAPPEGYQKNQEQQYYPDEDGFVVNYQNPTVTTTAVNKKLYQLELNKIDSDTELGLNNVPFVISKKEKEENSTENSTIYYLKLNAETNVFEWTENKDDANHFLTGKSYLSGQDGTVTKQIGEEGKIIVKYFPDAPNLSWEEVEVPKGYDSSGTLTGDFTPSTDNGYVYSATQTNSRLYQVSLEKKASDTEAALPGAVFSLEQQVGSDWKVVKVNTTTGEDGKITITPGEDGEDTITTDEDGKITISNLKAGTYRWKEVTAPDGYQISQPDPDGFEVTRDSVTRDSDSNLAIDPDTNNYIINPTIVENDREFELTLEKLASTFETPPLRGVKFELYDSDDSAGEPDFSTLTPEAIVTTDADGKIVLNNEQIQADKTYYLVESQTVDGFIQLKGYFTITTSKVDGINVTYVKADTETDSSPFKFTKKDGDIYSGHLKIYNKPKVILPATGGNGILGYVGIGLTMIIVALLFFIARKRNLNG